MANKKNTFDPFLTNTAPAPDIFELVKPKNTPTNMPSGEGELLVDVYQDAKNLYIRSTIAGATLDNLEILFHGGIVTIRGQRSTENISADADYIHQECYWGSFSRSITLPVQIKADKISAILDSGVLTVKLPKV